MYSQHPEMAKRWEKETPKGKKLPKRVKKSSADLAKEALVTLIKRATKKS